jgi:hypothetical protein
VISRNEQGSARRARCDYHGAVGPGAARFPLLLALVRCLLVALVGLPPAACVSRENRPDSLHSFDDDVRQYIRLVVALGSRDPDSLDFAYAPADASAERAPLPPFNEIRRRALDVANRLDGPATPGVDADRRQNLVRQLRAVAARVDLLTGKQRSFDEESQALFGVVAPRVVDADGGDVREEIARLRPGPGSLAARYAAFERSHLVPSDRVRPVFERALAECRARTSEHVSLPPDERVEIEYVTDSPWSGYSRYRGAYRSVVQVNVASGITVDGALVLACHEGYPGHHAQNSVREADLVRRRRWMEFTVQPLFSPQALLSEGLAVHAVDVAFPGATREAFERDVLFPLAGLDGRGASPAVAVERLVERLRPVEGAVAREYLDGRLEFARAAAAFTSRALVPQPDGLLRFLNEYRSFAVTYTYGPALIESSLDGHDTRDDPAARWSRFTGLLARPWPVIVR